ncbi:U-box domain-containing protein 33-like isoform X2 [Phragmites australis]|uniref:U-box domain-containing protein 33-like isoform X2 n=1 Tax=Phragmites australis TaxID=29695 RepID=UPI002D7A2454|nr:U-box domain-containing protein 33-like isoform X2 [Phragmites australis]
MEVGAIGREEWELEELEDRIYAEQRQEEQVVYCAVGKEAAKEWKANLQWVLANVPRSKRIVLAHLHRPASRINMMGAWVPVSQLAEEEVTAYRKLEEEKMGKVLDDLLGICRSQKVTASKAIIASDDTARGLVQLVDDHGVTELVMGAASDRAYTRKMRAPKSKKALTVQRKANPSCKIWFVCKGNLICTREATEGLHRAESSTTSTSSRSSTSDYSRSKSSPCLHSETFSSQESHDATTLSVDQTPAREDNAMDRNMQNLNLQATGIAGSSTVSISEFVGPEGEPAAVQSLQEIEEVREAPSPDDSDAGEMDDALYEKLKDALMEAENLKHEAYEETRRRQMAERDLADASKMADDAESSYRREAKHRKEVEEMLARERAEMERDRRELEDILEQIQKVNDRSADLELQITNSERAMSNLEVRLSESYNLLDTLRQERRQGEPATARESAVESEALNGEQRVTFSRFGYSEVNKATNHFYESFRIDGGAGGRGSVYRGDLRNMAVAVKVFSPDVAVDEVQFTRAVEAISRVRHPNLVSLVGACPEARAVVYEFVPGGSLEDRLDGESGAPPLLWHARCGIAYRTCSALAFLHSTLPRVTVHGDVRPANILLDERYTSCKLAGLGTHVLVEHRGGMALARPALAYTDPHYLATGELTPQCDVYSLGVVLLRLVTGRPAFLAKKAAQEAAGGSKAWHEVVDASAGGWPTECAREVALLGLKCCDVKRRPCRPGELLEEVRGVLEAAMSAAPSRSASSLSDGEGAPSYFLCPISKEVMRDPQIAGDGFTYEAEAIREWLGSGHDTSPMTNLKLPTRELIPNHALRSAIHEWRHGRAPRPQLDRLH